MVSVSDALIKIVTGLNNKLISFIESQSYNTSHALIKDVKIKKEVKSEPMDMELIVLEDRPISESKLSLPNQQRKGRPSQLFRGDETMHIERQEYKIDYSALVTATSRFSETHKIAVAAFLEMWKEETARGMFKTGRYNIYGTSPIEMNHRVLIQE